MIHHSEGERAKESVGIRREGNRVTLIISTGSSFMKWNISESISISHGHISVYVLTTRKSSKSGQQHLIISLLAFSSLTCWQQKKFFLSLCYFPSFHQGFWYLNASQLNSAPQYYGYCLLWSLVFPIVDECHTPKHSAAAVILGRFWQNVRTTCFKRLTDLSPLSVKIKYIFSRRGMSRLLMCRKESSNSWHYHICPCMNDLAQLFVSMYFLTDVKRQTFLFRGWWSHKNNIKSCGRARFCWIWMEVNVLRCVHSICSLMLNTPHPHPTPMSQNTLTSAVSSVRIRNVILLDSH